MRTVCAALAAHTLLLGAPLLPWADRLGGHPLLVLWLLAALALQLAELHAGRGRLDAPLSGGLDARLALTTALVLLGVQWLAALEHLRGETLPRPELLLGGLLALALGVTLRHQAMRALGPDFVSTVQGRAGGTLRRGGLYAWLRHPSELGLLLFALGSSLSLGSSLALGATLLGLLPLCCWRTRREDRALTRRFGEAHLAYRRTVGGLLPRPRRA